MWSVVFNRLQGFLLTGKIEQTDFTSWKFRPILLLWKETSLLKTFADRVIQMQENIESIQLLNTAIIKSKEKRIDITYESRLREICQSDVITALNKAIDFLSEEKKISRDHAATEIVNTVRELDNIWSDYVVMEGISKLKDILKKPDVQ